MSTIHVVEEAYGNIKTYDVNSTEYNDKFFGYRNNAFYFVKAKIDTSSFLSSVDRNKWAAAINRKLTVVYKFGVFYQVNTYTKERTDFQSTSKGSLTTVVNGNSNYGYRTEGTVNSDVTVDLSSFVNQLTENGYIHASFVGDYENFYAYSGSLFSVKAILEYDLVVPDVVGKSPVEGSTFAKSAPVTFKWSFNESGVTASGQKSFKLTYTNNGETNVIEKETFNTYYTFPAYTFSDGDVVWNIEATSNYGLTGSGGPYTGIAESSIPSATPTYPVNENVYKSQSFDLTWDFTETGATGQKSWSVEIGQNGVYETVSGEGDTTSVKFPAYKFEDGQVAYKITVTNNDDQSYTTDWYYFSIVPSVPIIESVYPIDVLVKKSKTCTFAWNYSESPYVGQVKYWITYNQGGDDVVVENESTNHYHTFDENTFDNGNCSYKIKVLNNDGQYVEIGLFNFTVVGDSDAPNITNVSQDAMPLIEWEIDTQDAYDVVIRDNFNNIVYESGLIVGSDVRSHKVNKLIENGTYYVYVRALNIYGYYTDYGSYFLNLNATCGSEISNVFVFSNIEYGINVDCVVTGGTPYVIRRKNDTDDIVILGKWEKEFCDYTIPGNDNYQYAIRLYDVGIKDSEWIVGRVDFNEIIIRDYKNPLLFENIWVFNKIDFNLIRGKSRSKSLTQCIGRIYPIKEVGEWMTSTINFQAYVSKDQLDNLFYISNNSSAAVQIDKEYLLCDMDISDNGVCENGRIVTIKLTQIDN